MTLRQAHKQAIKRWGKNGAVRDTGKDCSCGEKGCNVLHTRYAVGKVVMGMFFEVLGDGKSWDEAFADADEKKRKDDERYAQLRKEASR